jgi:very-short-patch-repair endonuclease
MAPKPEESSNVVSLKRVGDPIRDRAVRLFTFLREVVRLRSFIIRSLDDYEQAIFFSDIPQEHGCSCIAWGGPPDEENADVWIEIRKPKFINPPDLPIKLKSWLRPEDLKNSKLETLTPLSEIVEEKKNEDQTVILKWSEQVELHGILKSYLEEKWRPWAEHDQRLQRVQEIYANFFSLYQKQQRLGENFEVVLGLGLLYWKTRRNQNVSRHIITARTSIIFDRHQGVITIGPAGEGAKPSLEYDMLEPDERPNPLDEKAILEQVTIIGDELWDGIQIHDALKSWINTVSSNGEYEKNLERPNSFGEVPLIHFSPAIILRRRTERSLLRVYQEIVNVLENGKEIPPAIQWLVKDAASTSKSDENENAAKENSNNVSDITEIYFPLPANEQQQSIANKINSRRGVLVQGPPGTGKSHTITNLVCHLLAQGKKVLVTSHTARALSVLREKFLPDFRDLCVSLLGDDRFALQGLEDSVQGITTRYNNWNQKLNRQKIEASEKELDEVRREEAKKLHELRSIREKDTYVHLPRFGNYEGTAQTIAARLKEEELHLGWIQTTPREDQEPPLSDSEFKELLHLWRKFTPEKASDLSKTLPNLPYLLTPQQFSDLAAQEATAIKNIDSIGSLSTHHNYPVFCSIDKTLVNSFANRISDLLTSFKNVTQHQQAWAEKAALQALADRDQAWRDLHKITNEILGSLAPQVREVEMFTIAGLAEREIQVVKSDALELLSYLEKGGKIKVFFWFTHPKVKEHSYLIQEIRVNGKRCDNVVALRKLLDWINVSDGFSSLRKYWADFVSELPSGTFVRQHAEYRDLIEPLEKCLELHRKVQKMKELINSIPGLVEPTWHNLSSLEEFKAVVEAALLHHRFTEVKREMDIIGKSLSDVSSQPNNHPIARELLECITSRNVNGYSSKYHELEGLAHDVAQLARRNGLHKMLEADANKIAQELKETSSEPSWDKRIELFVSSWNWSRANEWIKKFTDSQVQERLCRELKSLRERVLSLLGNIGSEKAWGHCFSRLTEHERQHLIAWTKAMKRLGKGTGKHANMHRQAARENMEQCRSAIPAWIMPIFRVADTIRPGIDVFDVVIVDEASQSGPEAMFLQFLASKIIVVGDDKQIKPDYIGMDRNLVESLRIRHSEDIPHSREYSVDSSLFDIAEILYGDRIRLREHFRCMPEIIQFSNNLCYSSEPLIPLKQFGAGRLMPVIESHHVSEGYQEGSSNKIVNRPEAKAIVRQIKKCCEDSRYDGKTMGVISLLGDHQAYEIEKLLLKEVGPEAMEARKLICGDAYDFQGDERDVIFLSLVSAPSTDRRIGTLTQERDKRRFNVATSRAREQMWLFYSATLNDLSSICLRHQLLSYFLNPRVEPTKLEGVNCEALRKSSREFRKGENPPRPFDSWFEVDVFLKITERGYRVLPQYNVAGYRIDFVVEGMHGRLAVECDGDYWHGPAQYDYDMSRKRMLERCGYSFYNIRGTAYYRDPDSALQELWKKLKEYRIEPDSGSVDDEKVISSKEIKHSQSLPENSEKLIQAKIQSTPSLEKRESPGPLEANIATQVTSMEADTWFKIAHWAKINDKLEPWQRSLCYSLGKLAQLNHEPTQKQVVQGQKILIESRKLGYTEHVPSEPDPNPELQSELKFGAQHYRHWQSHPLPDPRTANLNEIIDGLLEIVSAESPIICHRVYHLYASSIGIGRIGHQIRSTFNRAISAAIRSQKVEQADDCHSRDQLNKVVRLYGAPTESLRSRGNRSLEEIPPSEIAILIKRILESASLNVETEQEKIFRTVLDFYGLVRMTDGVRKILRLALKISTSGDEISQIKGEV